MAAERVASRPAERWPGQGRRIGEAQPTDAPAVEPDSEERQLERALVESSNTIQSNPENFVSDDRSDDGIIRSITRREGQSDSEHEVGQSRGGQQDAQNNEPGENATPDPDASAGELTATVEGNLDSNAAETEGGNICAICHDEEGETNAEVALACGHKFHAVCLDDYFLFAQRKEVGIILLS